MPARLPEIAKTWIADAFADGGNAGLVAALVAALISMIGLATAGAALTRRRLAHMQWRARLRHSRPGLGWPTIVDAPRTDGPPAEVFEFVPALPSTPEDGAREPGEKQPHRWHAA